MDLGCGSGSLFEAILEQPLGLEHIVGVDTSHKGLIRAAKVKRPSPVCVHSFFFQKFARVWCHPEGNRSMGGGLLCCQPKRVALVTN